MTGVVKFLAANLIVKINCGIFRTVHCYRYIRIKVFLMKSWIPLRIIEANLDFAVNNAYANIIVCLTRLRKAAVAAILPATK